MKPIIEDKLRVLAGDELILSALDEVFRDSIEESKPYLSNNDTDEVIGQKYRAYTDAVVILDKALTKIKSYKEEKSNTNKFNKER